MVVALMLCRVKLWCKVMSFISIGQEGGVVIISHFLFIMNLCGRKVSAGRPWLATAKRPCVYLLRVLPLMLGCRR